jgi:hypothetical protein
MPLSASDRNARSVIKGVWPGISHDDIVLLWGGGLWSWLDPLTAIRAVDRARERHPTLRLIFPGTKHPNPALDAMPTHVDAAKALAAERHLIDTHVFFGDWIVQSDWPNVLRESDLALSLHIDSVETRLAYRSRMFDYVWAGLPTLCTTGDATSEIVREHGIGSVIGYGDDAALADAMTYWIDARRAPTFQAGLATAREAHTWERATEPLAAFCARPRVAADRDEARARLRMHYAARGQQAEILTLREERDALSTLVKGYERGKLMRLLAWLKGVRR